MNLSYKKIVASALVTTMTLALTLAPVASSADETVIELSRDEVGQMAVDYSPVIKGMESDLIGLSTSYTDLKAIVDGMDALHGLLPTYKILYNAYQPLSANHKTYLGLITSTDPADQAEAVLMIDGDASGVDTTPNNGTDDLIDLETAGNPSANMDAAAEATLLADIAAHPEMGPAEYGQFAALQTQFVYAGVTDPNLSSSQEYETFVATKVGANALQSGMTSLRIGTDVAVAGVDSGARSLYDGILMLQGIESLLEASYTSSLSDYESAEKKYEMGQLSEVDYTVLKNKEEIARRTRDSMNRDVDNMVMSFNVMLGQDVLAEIELTTPVVEEETMEALEFYLEKGLQERNEILMSQNNIATKQSEFDLIDQYYSSASDTYEIAEEELALLKLNHELVLKEVEVNINKAYLNVEEKKENLEVKKLAMLDSSNQYNSFKMNTEAGFMTQAMLESVQAILIQGENDYYSAMRDYMTALSALEGASTIGPAFSAAGAEGGMSFGQ